MAIIAHQFINHSYYSPVVHNHGKHRVRAVNSGWPLLVNNQWLSWLMVVK